MHFVLCGVCVCVWKMFLGPKVLTSVKFSRKQRTLLLCLFSKGLKDMIGLQLASCCRSTLSFCQAIETLMKGMLIETQ